MRAAIGAGLLLEIFRHIGLELGVQDEVLVLADALVVELLDVDEDRALLLHQRERRVERWVELSAEAKRITPMRLPFSDVGIEVRRIVGLVPVGVLRRRIGADRCRQ